MAALTFPGSLLSNQFQAQAPNEVSKAGAGSAEPGADASKFPALFEGMVGAPGASTAEREGEGATPHDAGLPAGERRQAGKNAGRAFPSREHPTAQARLAGRHTPGKGEAQEADPSAIQLPDEKQAPAVGTVAQAAHGLLPLVSPVPRRRGTAAEEQVAGLPAAPAAEQRVADSKGRLAAELAVAAGTELTGETVHHPSLASPLCEAPVEAPTIGLPTQGAASLLASKEAATAPRGGVRVAVPAANSLASPAIPRSILATAASKSPKTVGEQVLPLGPPDQEKTESAPAGALPAHALPVAAGLDSRSKLPEATAVRGVLPPLDTASDAPANTGENVGAADAKVRIMALGTADRGEVAFEVRVQAMATRPAAPAETGRPESPAKMAAAEGQKATRPGSFPEVAPTVAGEATAGSGDRNGAAADHERKQGADDRPYRSASSPASHAEGMADVPAGKMATHWSPAGALRQEAPPQQMAAPEARPARLEEAVKVDPKSEIQPAPAREIKLEVTGAEGRVEVRISDRGGEVRVAVRTPDHQLAGTLRESLPELATRLAGTGMRSEISHPAGSSGGNERHTAEMPAGNFAQDADSQSRGHGNAQGDAQERHRKNFQEQQQTHHEKRKDFAWLMSSLR